MAPKEKSDDRVNWTEKMDEYLIDVLKEEYQTNRRHANGTWKHEALLHTVTVVNQKSGQLVNVEKVHGRRRYLQKRYKKARECKDKSDFGWDPVTECFTADDIAWKEFAKAHPKLKSYRSKPVHLYDDLDSIFAEEKVMGLCNYEGFEAAPTVDSSNGDGLNEDDNQTEEPTSSTNARGIEKRKKRHHPPSEDTEELSLLKGMVDAAMEVAAALRPQK